MPCAAHVAGHRSLIGTLVPVYVCVGGSQVYCSGSRLQNHQSLSFISQRYSHEYEPVPWILPRPSSEQVSHSAIGSKQPEAQELSAAENLKGFASSQQSPLWSVHGAPE